MSQQFTFELGRLFLEAGLAVFFSFILGFALGLWVMTYLQKKSKRGKS